MSNDKDRSPKSGGLTRRNLLTLAGAAVGGSALGVFSGSDALAGTVAQCSENGRTAPTDRANLNVDVHKTRLKPGDLLVTDQYNAKVHLIRKGEVRPFIDVHSWGRSHLWDAIVTPDRKRVYITMSGLRGPNLDYVGIKGLGAVVEVDPESGEVLRVFSSVNENGWPRHQDFIDVTGMVLTSDGRRLLVNDFIGFAHRGMVLQFDLTRDGEMSVFTDGLMEPSGLSADGPDHVLIGNARMPGGSELGGQVVRMNVHTGEKEVLFDVNMTTGAMIGALRLADGSLVGTISDWPDQKRSTVIRIDGKDSYTELLSPELAFFSAQIAPDPEKGFWVAESVGRKLYRLTAEGEVLDEIALDDCAGGKAAVTPLARAFDTLESVRLVA